jgi:NADH-quinone oxidoreductase subunit J
MEQLFFYAFGVLAVAAAMMVILSRNPVHSVLFLVVTFFCLAGLFVLLDAHFLAAVQVLVYAGAIMVLFLFVMMLLNIKAVEREFEKLLSLKILGAGAVFFLLAELLYVIRQGLPLGVKGGIESEILIKEGNTRLIGKLLFTEYLLPFEITSILLIVAIIGAVVLAKRSVNDRSTVGGKTEPPKPSMKE